MDLETEFTVTCPYCGEDVVIYLEPEVRGQIVQDCEVALSPGVGFGPGGDRYVRFALIENEQRIAQGVRNLRRGLTKL